MSSNMDIFMHVLEEELRINIARSPGSYSYTVDELPAILDKFRAAIPRDGMHIGGPAFKATCRRLKIKNTYTSIRAFTSRSA